MLSKAAILPATLLCAGMVFAPIAAASDEPKKPQSDPSLKATRIPARAFRVIERESGDVNYYTVYEDPEGDFIRSLYRPPYETTVLGIEVPEKLRQKTKLVRWRWRALAMPKNASECKAGFSDSAAVVYVTFKRGLKWYSLKYVWSTSAKKGETCDPKRNPFVAQDTIVMESGGPTADWKYVEIDPRADFRNHFEGGNPNADVPDFVGIGIMSDGDQTQSLASADYGDFMIVE
jgi:hypothetical protein